MAQISGYNLAENTVGLLLPQFRDKNTLESILKGAAAPNQDIINTGFRISEEFGVDTHNEAMLDLVGKLLNVPKGGIEYLEEYRQAIKTRILVNSSTGSPKTLIPLLNELVGVGNYVITEQFPAEVNIRIYGDQTLLTKELINELLAVGVRGFFYKSPDPTKTVWELSEVGELPNSNSILPDLADIDITNKVMSDLIFN